MNQVLTDAHDGVQTITLNQPSKFNALSNAMLTELNEAVRTAERDSAVRAIVSNGLIRPPFSTGS